MSDSTSVYFQFPVKFLHFGNQKRLTKETLSQRVGSVIDWCVLDCGQKFAEKLPDELESANELVEKRYPEQYRKFQYDDSLFKFDELIVLIGMCVLNVGLNCAFSGFVENILKKHGNTIDTEGEDFGNRLVRLRSDLMWDALEKKGLAPNHLCVLAGILAGIGDRKFALLRNEYICGLASGFNSNKEASELGAEMRVTRKQVQTAIRELQARGFLRKITVRKTNSYFSVAMNETELANAVFKVESEKVTQSDRISQQDELGRKIDSELLKISAS